MKRIASVIALTAGLAFAQPAAAQGAIMASLPDVLGQVVAQGMGPAPRCDFWTSESERLEARAPSIATMQAYFASAQSGEAVSPHFKLDDEARWILGDQSYGMGQLDGHSDPLAAQGNRLGPEPLRAYRAGTFSSAIGQWAVYAPDDSIAGVYTSVFARERGDWKLRSITILQPGEELKPVDSFCRDPGDMTDYDLNAARDWSEAAQEMVADRQEDWDKANTGALEAEARLAEKPNSRGRKRTADRRRDRADRQAERLADAQENLAKASEALAEAEADHAAFLALTTVVENAESIRAVDEPDEEDEAS